MRVVDGDGDGDGDVIANVDEAVSHWQIEGQMGWGDEEGSVWSGNG